MIRTILAVLGLITFEVINSIDNAIVNAHTLKTMSRRARWLFLTVGAAFAIFFVRGFLPILIVWLTTQFGLVEVIQTTFANSELMEAAMEASAPLLLVGGGMFLVYLYLHWLFLDEEDPFPFFYHEEWLKPAHGVWAAGLSGILLVVVMYLMRGSPYAMLAAAIGSVAYLLLRGARLSAEDTEKALMAGAGSDIKKLVFLIFLDTCFSIDSVLGAFAFTTNTLLIIVGNGIGALVVMVLTVVGIEQVERYRWLKNGAMTSVGLLGAFMVLEALGVHVPEWISTAVTFAVVGLTFWWSHRQLKKRAG